MIRTIVYQWHSLLVSKFWIWPKFVEIGKEDIYNVVFEEIGIDVHLGPWFESKIDTEANAVFFQVITKGFKILGYNNIWGETSHINWHICNHRNVLQVYVDPIMYRVSIKSPDSRSLEDISENWKVEWKFTRSSLRYSSYICSFCFVTLEKLQSIWTSGSPR
jgi:hypothetical protein